MKPQESSFFRYRLHAVGLAVLGATLGAPAMAQWAQWSQSGYVGGSIGATQSRFDNAPATSPPTALTSTSEDDSEIGGKLFLGYQFHRNFAVEAGLFHLGSFDYAYGGPAGTISGTSRFRGLNLDLVGTLPITDRFSGIARIGAAYTQTRSSVATTGAIGGGGTSSDRNWGPKIGVGLEYAFTPTLSMRAELERYRVEDRARGRDYVDMASIGLVYRFGAPAPTMTRVVSPPPPPPPPPPRAVAVPPPPPAVQPPPPPPPPAPAPAPLPARPYRN